jgi:hypothetical protein
MPARKIVADPDENAKSRASQERARGKKVSFSIEPPDPHEVWSS